MGEHRSLREPRGAAGVDQPRGVVLVDLDRRLRCLRGPDEVVVRHESAFARTSDDDHVLDGRDVGQHRFDLLDVLAVDQQDARFGVVEDVRPLLGVEPVVQEGERHPGRGDAVVRLDVLRHVLGEDADAVALARHAEERVREPERPLVQAAEADLASVDDERGAVR